MGPPNNALELGTFSVLCYQLRAALRRQIRHGHGRGGYKWSSALTMRMHKHAFYAGSDDIKLDIIVLFIIITGYAELKRKNKHN